jgi:hypothetical protein
MEPAYPVFAIAEVYEIQPLRPNGDKAILPESGGWKRQPQQFGNRPTQAFSSFGLPKEQRPQPSFWSFAAFRRLHRSKRPQASGAHAITFDVIADA